MTPMKKELVTLAIVGIVIAAGYFVYVTYVPTGDGGDEYIPPEPGNDTDSDGLPDTWERSFWGNLAQTATGNPDGDAFTNLQEYTNGTNPTISDTPDEPSEYPGGWNIYLNPNYIIISQDTVNLNMYRIGFTRLDTGTAGASSGTLSGLTTYLSQLKTGNMITQIQYDCGMAQIAAFS